MRIFSNLNLSGDAPVRAQVGRGPWGPTGVPSTRWKKVQRILIPFVVVAIGVGLFFLGRMFYLILTGA
ncbi:hypothetical protein H5398_09770 [Tessaracoccus sp. MC1679]|uniref:hypothetical protein n=1 Tax=Tessaracoccus sp. MC1679 TaxID=2760313 RepID=UPI0016048CCB|nr:hypothetical protein [Tessaracoccus sp. MC1679]